MRYIRLCRRTRLGLFPHRLDLGFYFVAQDWDFGEVELVLTLQLLQDLFGVKLDSEGLDRLRPGYLPRVQLEHVLASLLLLLDLLGQQLHFRVAQDNFLMDLSQRNRAFLEGSGRSFFWLLAHDFFKRYVHPLTLRLALDLDVDWELIRVFHNHPDVLI